MDNHRCFPCIRFLSRTNHTHSNDNQCEDREELQQLSMRLSNEKGADYENSLSFMIARKRLKPVIACLACNNPLPLKPLKHVLNNKTNLVSQENINNKKMNGPNWQAFAIPGSVLGTKSNNQDAHHYVSSGGLGSVNKDGLIEMDPLLKDAQLLSRYPRMMPPPNRVRTAVGGGALGLGARKQIKASKLKGINQNVSDEHVSVEGIIEYHKNQENDH